MQFDGVKMDNQPGSKSRTSNIERPTSNSEYVSGEGLDSCGDAKTFIRKDTGFDPHSPPWYFGVVAL